MATWYINADTGSDGSGDGSQGSPWATISHVYGQASDGDTVIFQDSTSTYSMPGTTFNFDKSLTMEGESDDASGAKVTSITDARFRTNSTGKIIAWKKITFENFGTGSSYIVSHGVPVFELRGPSQSITLDQCIFRNITTPSAQYNGGIVSSGVGAAASGSTIIVSNCLIDGIVEFGSPPGAASQVTLIGNKQSSNFALSILDNTILLKAGHGFNTLFGYGIATGQYTEKGNLIKDQSGAIDHSSFHASAPLDIAENNHNGVNNLPSAVTSDSTNLTDDPLWVDEDNGNFNLAPGSTAIDSRTIE